MSHHVAVETEQEEKKVFWAIPLNPLPPSTPHPRCPQAVFEAYMKRPDIITLI